MARYLGYTETFEGGMKITKFNMLAEHREQVHMTNEEFLRIFMIPPSMIGKPSREHAKEGMQAYEPLEPINSKPRREDVIRHPSHPEYRPSNPWDEQLPEERPSDIKNLKEEFEKQRSSNDYLELYEDE